LRSGGTRRLKYSAVERQHRHDVSDAPSQLAVEIERGKDASRLFQVRTGTFLTVRMPKN
jgi:hypothetical protein